MNIEDIERVANVDHFEHLSVPATVTHPGELSKSTRVVIDRDVAITDEFGIVMETRCEIGLEMPVAGDGERGSLVKIKTQYVDELWKLLEPIGSDGQEARWTAAPADAN